VHAPSEEKSDELKVQVFDHFTKYHMKILLGDFNAKVKERIFSIQQLDRRVTIRIVTIIGLD